jgi:hypothetical protein
MMMTESNTKMNIIEGNEKNMDNQDNKYAKYYFTNTDLHL